MASKLRFKPQDVVLYVDVAEQIDRDIFSHNVDKFLKDITFIPEEDMLTLLSKEDSLTKFERTTLGDYVFVHKPTGAILAVYELKTLADLRSSVMDGRYKEQKERLKALGCPYVQYLITDDFNEEVSMVDVSRTMSIIHSTHALWLPNRDLVPAYMAKAHTELCKRGPRNDLLGTIWDGEVKELITLDYVHENLKKKQNGSPRDVLVAALSTINGISNIIAKTIASEYGSIGEIVERIKERKNPMMFSGIKVGRQNLGPVKSRRICELFCDMSFPEEPKKKKVRKS